MRFSTTIKVFSCIFVSLILTDTLLAQFTPNQRAARNSGYRAGYRQGSYVPPPAYGYPAYYRKGPYEGYLSGVSDVVNAQGQYGIDYQQARQMNQKSEQEKIKTRRMLIDQRRYEESLRPKPEEVRREKQQQQLARAMNQAPRDEILSGKTLNVLLTDQKQQMASGLTGPTVMLSSDILRQINVTSNVQGGNVGILKNGGKLDWPIQLRSKDFQASRQQIDSLMSKAVEEANRDSITFETVTDLSNAQQSMYNTLLRKVKTMSLSDYIPSKKYLQELDDGIQALKAPGANNYFNGKWAAEGDTVEQLVRNMSQKGLTFAPSTRGSETAYQALYQSMLSYQLGVMAMLPHDEKSSNSPGERPSRP